MKRSRFLLSALFLAAAFVACNDNTYNNMFFNYLKWWSLM